MSKPKRMTRRQFFVAGAGLIGVSAFSHEAFSSPQMKPTSKLSASGDQAPSSQNFSSCSSGPERVVAPPSKSRVLLVKTGDRSDGVRKCFEFFKDNPFRGKSVLIKPNFNTSDETPGSTHNDTLKAIMTRLRELEAKELTIGDRSGPEPTDQVFDKKGIRQLAASFKARLLNFDELGPEGYLKVNPPRSHWQDGFLVARPVVEAECLISTCCLKTHGYGGVFTMSLKNSVGCVPRKGHTYMRELHSSPNQRKMIAEINYAYQPTLVILDGLVAFVDKGPMTGPRKEAGVFLAGTDRVAVDAVGLAILKELGSNEAIMKPKIFEQEQIARAAELGLGVTSPADIIIETLDAASEACASKIRQILLS
jgi:uncharacterized protein (DUF362 family)